MVQEEELQSLRIQLQTLKERYQALQKSQMHDNDQMLQRKSRELILENEKLKSTIEQLSTLIQEQEKKILNLQSAGNDLGILIEETQQNLQQTQEALRKQTDESEQNEASWKEERAQLIQERDQLLVNQETLTHKMRERIEELETLYNETETRLQQQAAEKQHAQEDAAKAKTAQDDAEGRLKFAHYHLAKKVKETTELTDKVHALENQLRDHDNTLKHLTEQNASLQEQLTASYKQEKELSIQMEEKVRATESKVEGWETRYAQLQKRWEEDEAKIKELTKVADRYHQMHSLWNNLNEFFTDVDNATATQAAQPATPAPPAPQQSQPAPKPYQNLFEPPSYRFMSNMYERE